MPRPAGPPRPGRSAGPAAIARVRRCVGVGIAAVAQRHAGVGDLVRHVEPHRPVPEVAQLRPVEEDPVDDEHGIQRRRDPRRLDRGVAREIERLELESDRGRRSATPRGTGRSARAGRSGSRRSRGRTPRGCGDLARSAPTAGGGTRRSTTGTPSSRASANTSASPSANTVLPAPSTPSTARSTRPPRYCRRTSSRRSRHSEVTGVTGRAMLPA